jgi:hypothetical protein
VDDEARRVPMPQGVKTNTIMNAWITCIAIAAKAGKTFASGKESYIRAIQKMHTPPDLKKYSRRGFFNDEEFFPEYLKSLKELHTCHSLSSLIITENKSHS